MPCVSVHVAPSSFPTVIESGCTILPSNETVKDVIAGGGWVTFAETRRYN